MTVAALTNVEVIQKFRFFPLFEIVGGAWSVQNNQNSKFSKTNFQFDKQKSRQKEINTCHDIVPQ